jgi:hypothetical protein
MVLDIYIYNRDCYNTALGFVKIAISQVRNYAEMVFLQPGGYAEIVISSCMTMQRLLSSSCMTTQLAAVGLRRDCLFYSIMAIDYSCTVVSDNYYLTCKKLLTFSVAP